MVPYMDKEEKGFKRYSLIAKMTKIFNKNNFPKLQQTENKKILIYFLQEDEILV